MANLEFDIMFSLPDPWQSKVTPMDAENVFLYRNEDRFARDDAYIIVPHQGDTTVVHVFGGVNLLGLQENRCRLYSWNGPLAQSLNEISDDDVYKREPEVLSLLQMRWPDAEIIMAVESLVLVRCGRYLFYVATRNRR